MLKKQRFFAKCLQGMKYCRTFAVQTTKKSYKRNNNTLQTIKELFIMRQIEKNMLRALARGENWSCGNTSVFIETIDFECTANVYLHGNCIYKKCGDIREGKDTEYISLCGWNSVTTRSRLRALGVNITTKQGVPYIGGKSVSSYGVYEIDRSTGNLA